MTTTNTLCLWSLVAILSTSMIASAAVVAPSPTATCDKYGCSCYPYTESCAADVRRLTGCQDLTCGVQGRDGLCSCTYRRAPRDIDAGEVR